MTRRERIVWWLATHLPKSVALWSYIHLTTSVACKELSNKELTSIAATDVYRITINRPA